MSDGAGPHETAVVLPGDRLFGVERDGVRLCYVEQTGSGMPVILVHGWCCDHSFMSPLFEHFAGRGHHVVAIDLRGHGGSDRPFQRYAIADFADDVVWLAGRLGIKSPLVVGHSMGGIIAFDIAARHPRLPSAIAMIDAAVVRPSSSRTAIGKLIEQLRGDDYVAVLRDYVDRVLFLPTDTPALKDRILDGMGAATQHVAAAAMEGLRDYEPEIARGRLAVPSLYIAADETPRTDIAVLKQLVPQLAFGQTVGSGHFCQMEVPDQVNAMIDRFIAIAFAGR